ncbi:hypothetical protein ACFXPS_43680 [Nocardia sp. NPDC059091]|uniref:hypothetical protein n=1 Tax=unclassified Nocardia TaxID=2637762 RepID=UPI00369ECBD6
MIEVDIGGSERINEISGVGWCGMGEVDSHRDTGGAEALVSRLAVTAITNSLIAASIGGSSGQLEYSAVSKDPFSTTSTPTLESQIVLLKRDASWRPSASVDASASRCRGTASSAAQLRTQAVAAARCCANWNGRASTSTRSAPTSAMVRPSAPISSPSTSAARAEGPSAYARMLWLQGALEFGHPDQDSIRLAQALGVLTTDVGDGVAS